MSWEVEFTDEFEAWFDDLSEAQQTAIDRRVHLLREEGPHLGAPHVKRIVSSALHHLKERRCSTEGELRVLFAFDPRRSAILLLGGDKTGDWVEWYEIHIPLAEEIYVQYLKELQEEGLI